MRYKLQRKMHGWHHAFDHRRLEVLQHVMSQSKAVALFVFMAAIASVVLSRVGGSVFIGRSSVAGGGSS